MSAEPLSGLELSRRFFFAAGLPLLREIFPALCERVAAGLLTVGYQQGAGSEVGGFDDAISRDHNWGPRFLLFLNEDDWREHGSALEQTLNERLPTEFEGWPLHVTTLSDRRATVLTPHMHLRLALDLDDVPATFEEWLALPEYLLFEYTAGEVFYEPAPLVTPLRARFAYYPEQVWHKRLAVGFFCLQAAGNALRMARRGDMVAARLYLDATLETVMRLCFLLRRRYAPYRKWLFRAFQALPALPAGLVAAVEQLATRIALATLETETATLLDLVGAMANDSGLIPLQPLHTPTPFVWTDFNCYGFAAAFDTLLPEPLRSRLTSGPIDLWVSNHAALSPAVARAALA